MGVCEKVESLEGQIREREKKGEEKKIRKRSSICIILVFLIKINDVYFRHC